MKSGKRFRFCLMLWLSLAIGYALGVPYANAHEVMSKYGSNFPDEDSEVDQNGVATPDGLTNQEEAGAHADPSKRDTDNDGTVDGLDGWAGGINREGEAKLAPPRLNITQYAVIDLGLGNGQLINNSNQVVFNRAGKTYLWDNGTQREVTRPPEYADYSVNHFFDLNNSGVVLMEADNEIGNSFTYTWQYSGTNPTIQILSQVESLFFTDPIPYLMSLPLQDDIGNPLGAFGIPWLNAHAAYTPEIDSYEPQEYDDWLGTDFWYFYRYFVQASSLNDIGIVTGLYSEIGNLAYTEYVGQGAHPGWDFIYIDRYLSGYKSNASAINLIGPVGKFSEETITWFKPIQINNANRIIGYSSTFSADGEIDEPGWMDDSFHILDDSYGLVDINEAGHILGYTMFSAGIWVNKGTSYDTVEVPNVGFYISDMNEKMQVVGERATQSGWEPMIWQNFEAFSLKSLVPATQGDTPQWTELAVGGINDSGVIVGTAVKAGQAHAVMLVPVDITVRKKGTSAAPNNGLLVKKGDILEFALAPQYFDQEKQFETLVTWEYRQLRGDGTFDPAEPNWTGFGADGKGTKFEHITTVGGIYQVRAVINSGGTEQKLQYVRKKDTPANFITDSMGNKATIYAKGEPDYVGVADQDLQIAVRNQALADLGIRKYAQSVELPAHVDRGKVWANDNKCNAFVYDKAVDGGCSVPSDDWSITHLANYPPSAHAWWDPAVSIANWTRLPTGCSPQPGYITAGPEGTGGHAGILDYDGAWINAGRNTVNKFPHRTFCVDEPYKSSAFRKYMSSSQ